MAVVNIRQFGGILPALEPRSLPADGAQTALNLDLRRGDFRPLAIAGASAATVTNNAMSVHRTPSGAWLHSALDVDYVNGQIQDTATERVYLTGRAEYPEAWQSNEYRRLGVPRPTAAPTVTVTPVGEFSTSELTTARSSIPKATRAAFDANLDGIDVGATPSAPSGSTPGWLHHGAQGDLPTKSSMQWAFLVPMTLSGSDYVMTDPVAHNFLQAPELGGKRVTYSAAQWWAVPIYMQGRWGTVDQANLKTALLAIQNPAVGGALWTSGEADTIVANTVAYFDQAKVPTADMITAIASAQAALGKVYDSAASAAELKASMKAFFLRTEVVNELAAVRGTNGSTTTGTFAMQVAGNCYEMGHYKTGLTGTGDVTATRYFNPGADATSYANIRTDYDACIVEDVRGAKILNRVTLAGILRAEMEAINVQRAAADRWPNSHIDAKLAEQLTILERVFTDAHWEQNPAFPSGRGADARNSAAAVSARDELRLACETLGGHYDAVKSEVIDYIEHTMFDVDVLPKLPEAVDRIEESRSYVITYVTDWDEESAPSDPSPVVDCDQNDLVGLVIATPPSGRNIRKARLYRSSVSSSGAAFQFVVENASDVSDVQWPTQINREYTDQKRQEDLQEVCPSLIWDEPPAGLMGLVGMPNGIMIGFVGRQLYACVPYQPYAFPTDYMQTVEFNIVGIGVIGQTAVVLTTGTPYYVSGADSASLSVQKIESNQACVSKRSIASSDGGVFYASPDGICLANASGVQVLTEGAYGRREWQALTPAGSIGRFHDGVYYLALSSGTWIMIDLVSKRVSTMSIATTGMNVDLLTDTLYYVTGTTLLPAFGGASNRTGTWKSKVVVAPTYPGFGVIRVESDFESTVTVKLYGDGGLFHTATFTSRTMQRLPALKYRDYEVQIEAACPVTAVVLATSPEELAAA